MVTDPAALAGALAPHRALMRSFSDGAIAPEQFAQTYIKSYLADPTNWADAVFLVLDRVFAMADNLDLDPDGSHHDEFSVSPDELVECVRDALRKLDELVPNG